MTEHTFVELRPRGPEQERRLACWSLAEFLQYARERLASCKPEHTFATHMWRVRVDTTATLLEHHELATHRMVTRA